MSNNIRLAVNSDYDSIVELINESFTKYIELLNQKPSSMVTDFSSIIAKKQMYIMTHCKKVIGTIALKTKMDAVWISSMAVKSGYQKKGLGKKLIKFAEQKTIGSGLNTICLYTSTKIPELFEYYVKLGFKEFERKFEDGFERVYLSKNLLS